ncbi:FtsW/RodA/SpoVE family cell cycle protein, partial [Patescibacteria group bacterium]|nr:FtsW/RodA/SpoVE family cell cycle protein [Patescibacteria group bacterium]MBU1921929.1 FtsW/RodA/SpoVE family cell cycle protein [Patescibacteria group bacterium]
FLIFIILGTSAWSFGLQDYQKERVLTFLDQGRDPLGQGYNVTQSVIAIGSGGVFGRGLGFGSQSQLKFLPESQTDFIFAVIAEELGLVGIGLILGLFAIVFWRLFKIAQRAHDDFSLFLVLGVSLLLFIQVGMNAAMNLGMFPVTGITLPFLSYGASSLLVFLVLIGVAQSIAMREVSSRLPIKEKF